MYGKTSGVVSTSAQSGPGRWSAQQSGPSRVGTVATGVGGTHTVVSADDDDVRRAGPGAMLGAN